MTAIIPHELGDHLHATIQALEDGTATDEQVLTAHDRWLEAKRLFREFSTEFEAALVKRLEKAPVSRPDGSRLYAAPNRTTKAVSKQEVLNALLRACDGDVDDLAECLASQPFKHGTARQRLSEQDYARLFVTETTHKAKQTDPPKRLQVSQPKHEPGSGVSMYLDGHPQESNQGER